MILFQRFEKLGAHLAELKTLMDRYERGEMTFVRQSIDWLSEAEKTLAALRLTDASELSTLRGRIVKTDDVTLGSDGQTSRSALRRARNAAAHAALERAESILRGRVTEAEERLQGYEEKLAQAISAAMAAGLIPQRERGQPPLDWLKAVWLALNLCPQTRPLSIYLAASLSAADRYYILNNVMSRLNDPDLPIVPFTSGTPDA